ncbi:regulator of nonsense transcripts 3A-like isoform X1 [Oncorhynchus keta]|uniref:regulator of nonsense transcripts 3A-like isoform X1 n=1 Tax=Oncorhynchus keta TaxID=8018 RepID=UPI0015FBD247|nr:regulator of nonsense transcripts 3A-like isoform X1 [Oncorhynchus keta]XP_035628973.1 regulator of nonsense transcripts 3A-like isoform X1 [Oncorhynchus keta]
MRSETDQMTGGREESVVEIQFRDIPRGQDAVFVDSKQKEEKKEVFTKVVIRRLPPNLSKDQLEEQLSPLPSYDYFEFFPADQSLYPHLFSRVYINFRNPEDILLFRDRFDGYVFIDNRGQEYPAVVEFAPFQKVSKKKLKKKDSKAGSIEEDPEYRRFLENYSCDEEKSMANPETLLGEIEAKTKKLIAKRTTPLLEYIKNKKLEKHRIREEKREERRRRELEKKRQREEEKRKRREEERRKRKEADKQKKLSEKEIKIKLLKKSDWDDDVDSDRLKDKGDSGDTERAKWDKPSGHMKSKETKDPGQMESDKEQREHGRRQRDKDHRGRDEERKRQRHHYEFDKSMRCKEDTNWGKGYCQDRAKKDGQYHSSYSYDTCDKVGKEAREDIGGSRKDRVRNKVSDKACVSQSVLTYQDRRMSQSEGPHQIRGALPNKDRPAMQLYQPGAHNRKRVSSAMKGYELPMNRSPEHATADHCYEAVAMETGSEKSGDE